MQENKELNLYEWIEFRYLFCISALVFDHYAIRIQLYPSER